MNSTYTGIAVFACLFGASLFGLLLRARIPVHHLDSDSRDVIRLATAVVGTLSALALGLLIASAKNAYDTTEAELRTSVARVVLLDRVMARYGPETDSARGKLRVLIENRLQNGWEKPGRIPLDPYDVSQTIEPIQVELRALSPGDESQRMLRARALDVSGHLRKRIG